MGSVVASGEIGELAKALATAQAEMGAARKDSKNPFFKSTYADFNSVVDALKEPFAKNGLSYSQPLSSEGDDYFVTTILMHVSGQFVKSDIKLILAKRDMQGLIASSTYARRCMLSAIAGLPQDDDDGEESMGRGKKDSHATHPTSKPIVPAVPIPGPSTPPPKNITPKFSLNDTQISELITMAQELEWSGKDLLSEAGVKSLRVLDENGYLAIFQKLKKEKMYQQAIHEPEITTSSSATFEAAVANTPDPARQ